MERSPAVYKSHDLLPPVNPGSNLGATLRAAGLSGEYVPARPLNPVTPEQTDYWRLILSYKGRIVASALLGALLGYLITIPQKRAYDAFAVLEVQAPNQEFMNLKAVDPTADTGRVTAESFVSTQAGLLRSETLLERTLNRLDDSSAHFQPQSSSKEEAIELAQQKLRVKPLPGTQIIEVHYESGDPAYAARFVNTLAHEFLEWDIEKRMGSTNSAGSFLSAQLDDLQRALNLSEERLRNYALQSGLIVSSQPGSFAEDSLRQIQQQVADAHADRVAKQSRYELLGAASPETLPDVLDHPSLAAYQQELNSLQRTLAEASTLLTPAHYRVKQLQAKIDSVQATIAKERSNITERIRNEFDVAQRREKLLVSAYLKQARMVSDHAAKSVQYDLLKQEVDSNRQLYQSVLQKVKEANVASAIPTRTVRVIDPARPPRRPIKPAPLVTSALGLFSGLFLGLGLVFLREQSDRSIRNPGVVPRFLPVSELGVIPRGPRSLSLLTRLRNGVRRGRSAIDGEQDTADHQVFEGPGRHSAGPPAARRSSFDWATWNSANSPVAEAFRATLASLLLNGAGTRPRVLVVSSAGPGEGKTSVAANLAAAVAQMRRNVLLIDTDVKRPRLHEVYGVPNGFGFGDLLRKPGHLCNWELDTAVRATAIPGVYLIPSGSNPGESHAALLYSDRLTELLLCCRRAYHTVIIDSAPLLAVSDARLLGKVTDGVLLVVRSGKTELADLRLAVARLEADGVRIVGSVLTDWAVASGTSAAYRHYHKVYGRRFQLDLG
jgi:polysaccharide biosynthesis transport protein